MSTLLVWREKLQKIYASYSLYIVKALQLLLGLVTFALINSNIGYMKAASSFLCTAVLAVICAFLPIMMTVLAAAALVLLHLYALSAPIAALAFAVFFLMFVFYFRFTPGKAWLILISVLAFGLKIPFVVPVAFGLLGTPIWIIPASFGIIAFYLVELVKTSSTTLKNTDSDAMISGLTAFARQFAGNKEMWLMVAAVVLGTLFVHMIRTRSIDHAWKIASAAGAGICVIVASVGNLLLNGSISYIMIVLSALLGAAVGIVLEFLFFSVDYSRSENIQFEDDEYYYYVKAIPKIGVSVPEKSVKQITGRRKHPERGSETDLSGADDAGFRENPEDPERSQKSAEAKKQNTEEILLTRSLSRELGLDTEERDSE